MSSPTVKKGEILLLDDGNLVTVIEKDVIYDDSFRYSVYYDYFVTVEYEDGTRKKFTDWYKLEGRQALHPKYKVGDVVEVHPQEEESVIDLDHNPRGKIVRIDTDDMRRPYIIRSMDGGHELPFSVKEFTKVLSATSYEKRGETIDTLDKQIKKFDEKIESLTVQRDALKVAREVMDYVVT